MLRASLILTVCIALAVGQEQTGEIVTSFDLFNGSQVQEDAGVFQGCVMLDQSPSTNIDITVVAGTVFLTEIDVNFGNPMPVLTFTPTSETRMCFEIPIIEDGLVQTQSQIFSLSLETSAQNVVLASQAFIMIVNTDSIQVSFESAEYTSDESLPVEVCAVVVSGQFAAGSTGVTAMVTYIDDTVTAGLDYVPQALEFTFISDNTRVCGAVSIIDDPNPENTESLRVVLTATPTLEAVENSTATIYIIDNDRATIGFNSSSYTFSEGDFNEEMEVNITVLLLSTGNGVLERPVQGRVMSEDITATGGVDYVPVDLSFNFDNRSSNGDTYTFSVTIIGDNQQEVEETFRLVLTSQSGDTVNPDTTMIAISVDDGDSNTCLMLRNITNGQVVTTGFDEGNIATYSCNEDFTLSTMNAVRTCQSSGSWTGEEPECSGARSVVSAGVLMLIAAAILAVLVGK